MANRLCPFCGAELKPEILGGLCPKCVLKKAMAEAEGADEEQGRGPKSEGIGQKPDGSGQAVPPRAATTPPLTEQAGDRIGRYKLIQHLGEGGMGSVWMAEQTEPVRRLVALKVVKAGMDSAQVLARFEAERQALALMDHPNIAKVLDAGATPNGRPYFVMDLVKGIPFTEFCDEQRLSVRERLELFMPVCQAVQHAHQKGIIHRDLKPSNVLVALYDGRPVPKVIDFGTAKAMGQRLTERTLYTNLGAVVGTLEYMSPEQAELNQLDIDTRSDIYSLGVLLYELLTGTTPLRREKLRQAALDEVLKRIREEEPPKPSLRLSTSREQLPTISAQRKLEPDQLAKTVQGELDWIVMKALDKDRNRRYETANSLALDLQHYLNDEPVAAGPPTARYRLKKFVRKHRKPVAVAAGFVVLLAVASVVSTGLALWANREREDKVAQRLRAEQKTVAESMAKSRADQQRLRAEDLLQKLELQRVEDDLALDREPRALAHLARILRSNPTNRVAAERLIAMLAQRNYALRLGSANQMPPSPITRTNKPTSPDGRRQLRILPDWSYRICDAETGQALTIVLEGLEGLNSAEFSPDGFRLATASRTGAQLWDSPSGHPLCPLIKYPPWVLTVQFSPNGLSLATAGCGDNTARLRDGFTGKPLARPLMVSGEYPHSAVFSVAGDRVITTTTIVTTNRLRLNEIWNALPGPCRAEPLLNTNVWPRPTRIDVNLLTLVISNSVVRLLDRSSGQQLGKPLELSDRISCARLSRDGKWIAAASRDGTARIWELSTRQPSGDQLRHQARINSIEFSPDSLRAVTASDDKAIRIWDVATGLALSESLMHDGPVQSAWFSEDGRKVIVNLAGGVGWIWDLPVDLVPVPSWIQAWAEAVAGFRLSEQGILEKLPLEKQMKIEQQIRSSPARDVFAIWAKWFFADRSTRTISPFSSVTVPEYVQHRIQQNTLESLNEAVRLAPTNGLAYARLANLVLAQKEKDNPRRIGEADFFSRYALKWWPNDPEVAKIRAEIVARMEVLNKP